MNQLNRDGWRQVDAGLWIKPARAGHVEIAFASARDGTALFEVQAYDGRGHPTDEPFAGRCYGVFDTACRVGDLLSAGSVDMGGICHA